MPHVSLRVTEQEKTTMESYAQLHGLSLSDAIKNVFFEMLEDEYDLKCIEEYEKGLAENGPGKTYTMEEVKRELGL